ncbi:MAG: hypothetical protein AAGI66_01735 [Cyanobacteria bacterium P01_H01_bin.74]
MTNFFSSPALTALQNQHHHQYLDAIAAGQNVLITLPLATAAENIYGLAAITSPGLTVVVSANALKAEKIHRFYLQAGFNTPEVLLINGFQAPHEQRKALESLNRGKTQILSITADKFCSLLVLQVLVHIPINRLIIDDADLLLEAAPYAVYQRFKKNGLSQLKQLPPITLSLPYIAHTHINQLIQSIGSKTDTLNAFVEPHTTLAISPDHSKTRIKVNLCFTQHQKAKNLIAQLKALKTDNKQSLSLVFCLTRTHEASIFLEALLHKTGYPQAFRLAHALNTLETAIEQIKSHLDSLNINSADEKLCYKTEATDTTDTIANGVCPVVLTEAQYRLTWLPAWQSLQTDTEDAEGTQHFDQKTNTISTLGPVGQHVVFWQLPDSLDSITAIAFRAIKPVSVSQPCSKKVNPQTLTVLYTKEDYLDTVAIYQQQAHQNLRVSRKKQALLKQLRVWLLRRDCRLAVLQTYQQTGQLALFLAPCGRCDNCTTDRFLRVPLVLHNVVQQLLY